MQNHALTFLSLASIIGDPISIFCILFLTLCSGWSGGLLAGANKCSLYTHSTLPIFVTIFWDNLVTPILSFPLTCTSPGLFHAVTVGASCAFHSLGVFRLATIIPSAAQTFSLPFRSMGSHTFRRQFYLGVYLRPQHLPHTLRHLCPITSNVNTFPDGMDE